MVHTLQEGEIVAGMTSLADEVYVLREKERDQVEVYDVINYNYRLKGRLTVPNSRTFNDMTSCEHYRCLYIADDIADHNAATYIHRLDVQGAYTRWAVNDKPWGLSVNAAHNVLVTCPGVRKIKEFSSHGDPLCELTLPDDYVNPWHAIQLTSGHVTLSHGGLDDAVHRVCMITPDGRDIVKSHGSDTGQYNVPFHLAVDTNNGFMFVADMNNRRVTLLSPTLDYVRQVVTSDKLKWLPVRLYFDTQRRRLYVADNEWKDGTWTAGRVVVFSV